MPPAEVILLLAGAAVAGFVQGVSGFAFSMVAMSIWVWGLEPGLAAVMAVFGSLVGQVVGLFSVRRSLSWGDLAPFLLGGLLGVPIGVALLPRLDANVFKLVLGLVLVVTCPAMLLAARLPRVELCGTAARVGDAAAGLGGGLLGGLGGFTGVVPTLWCTLRGLDKAAQRTVVQNFNLTMLAVTMAAYVASGAVSARMWPLMPWVAAALVVPSLLGARLYHRLGEHDYRRVVLSLLTAMGITLCVAALRKLLSA